MHLCRYIGSRGTLHNDAFIPSTTTKFFRNTQLTKTKIAETLDLIKQLESAGNMLEIFGALQEKESNETLLQSKHTSGFREGLKKCYEEILDFIPPQFKEDVSRNSVAFH